MLRKEECLLCHAPLIYLPAQEEMRCALCHTARCENGHYICDACHQKEGLAAIRRMCLASSSKNPMAIAREIMGSPFIHMHGPEHHVLVGACLLAAYANAGGRLDLPAALLEMEHRGSQVPGGICGLWGCCGAAVSAGIYWSIVTEASPLSTKAWRQANELTARCLTAIAKLGGPRCCKRDSFTAILVAADMTRTVLHIPLAEDPNPVCGLSWRNAQCIGQKCPYWAG